LIGDDKFVIEFIGSFPKFTVNKIVELYQVDIGINIWSFGRRIIALVEIVDALEWKYLEFAREEYGRVWNIEKQISLFVLSEIWKPWRS